MICINNFKLFIDKKPPKEWPNNGQIVFKNLSLRYSLDTPHVLKNLNIIIQPMEKVKQSTYNFLQRLSVDNNCVACT